MEADLIDIIREARNTWSPNENDGNPSFSMPDSGHPPINSSFYVEKQRGKGRKGTSGSTAPDASHGTSSPVAAYQWSEASLRAKGSNRDRTIMAVRDAARRVAGKGRDPFSTPFFVSDTIARGWDLNVRQLSEGLKDLAEQGCIAIKKSKQGSKAQITLIRKAPS